MSHGISDDRGQRDEHESVTGPIESIDKPDTLVVFKPAKIILAPSFAFSLALYRRHSRQPRVRLADR